MTIALPLLLVLVRLDQVVVAELVECLVLCLELEEHWVALFDLVREFACRVGSLPLYSGRKLRQVRLCDLAICAVEVLKVNVQRV